MNPTLNLIFGLVKHKSWVNEWLKVEERKKDEMEMKRKRRRELCLLGSKNVKEILGIMEV